MSDTHSAAASTTRRSHPREVTPVDVKETVEQTKKFKLSRPIKVDTPTDGTQTLTELEFRLPNFGDIMKLPLPYSTYTTAGRLEITPNGPALQRWIESLVVSPGSRSELEALAARDGMAIYNWLCEEINVGTDAGN